MSNLIDLKLARNIISENGIKSSEIVPLKTGKFNSTFLIRVGDSLFHNLTENKLILRIAPSDKEGFIFYEKNMMAQEPIIHEIVNDNTSIPVPEIYLYDDSREVVNRDYLLMEYIEGKALSEIDISADAYKKIMEKMGVYLSQLHENCRGNNYGYLGPHNCMEPSRNWKDAFEIMWNKLIDNIEDCGVYSEIDAEMARSILNDKLNLFEYRKKASLLHMDIWQQNILVDTFSEEIKGIIDWDRSLWGDPGIEFSVLDYCGFNNKYFWQGYDSDLSVRFDNTIRNIFYKLYEIQKYLIIWKLREKNREKEITKYKNYSLEKIDEIKEM